jgi:hypothetical protein
MNWIMLLIYPIFFNSRILKINNCTYNNTEYFQGQYTWISEEDAQCYCNNGTWTDCD